MANNIITAAYSSSNITYTKPAYQYDYGMILKFSGIELPQAYEVHFSNTEFCGESISQIGDADGVTIPDEMFLNGNPIYAWTYLHTGEDDGETVYKAVIGVNKRAKPSDIEPTPVQQDVITQAIAALNVAVEQTAQDVIDATAAKDAAETAQGLAESARDAAETAQGKADDAQEAAENAQEAAETAQGKAEDAQEAAEQAAGAVLGLTADATVDANIGTPSVEVDVSTVSDHKNMSFSFHNLKGVPGTPGQDGVSPTVSVSEITGGHEVEITDKVGTQTFDVMDGTDGQDGVSPTVTVTEISGGHNVEITDAQGTQDFDVLDGEITSDALEERLIDKADIITSSASGEIVTISDGGKDLPVVDLKVSLLPVQSGSGDPSPDNIRPISGWTGVDIHQAQINLLDPNDPDFGLYTIGPVGQYVTSTPDRITTGYIPCKQGDLVTFDTDTKTSNTGTKKIPFAGFAWYDANKTFLSRSSTDGADTFSATAPTNACFFRMFEQITVWASVSSPAVYQTFGQRVYIGSGVTNNLPYSKNYPIDWTSSAGTVYGCNIDPVSGVLTVDRVKKVFDGTESFTRTGSNNATTYFAYTLGAFNSVKSANCICSVWLKTPITSSNTDVGFNVINSTGFNAAIASFRPAGVYVDGVRMTVAQFQQILADLYSAGTPCEIVYELATPTTYQLTPSQISTFLGTNNFWSNGNGTLDLEYRCDTKLYIENLTKPSEDDMTANKNITLGEFFMVGNHLYQASSAISTGETIAVGTNCTELSLADGLNLLKNS